MSTSTTTDAAERVEPPEANAATYARVRPLTSRILARLPGRRLPWIAVWACVPWLNAAVNLLLDVERSAVWEQRRALVILNYVALSAGIVISAWGAERVARRIETLRVPASQVRVREPFREMNSVVGPLVAAGVTAVAFGATAFVTDGWAPGVLRGATWFVLGVALWTFLWTYASLQLGLDRLGREHLVRDATRVDPTLGLQPLGGVAFMGLWMLLAWLVPVLLTGLQDVVGFVIGMLVLGGALSAFFFSLFRLHRQMVAVKTSEVAVARELYAHAYEPVRLSPTLETLERQRSLLGAAEALEKRAQSIHEWPIDEGTLARVLTIATSVIAMAVARLLLDPLGL